MNGDENSDIAKQFAALNDLLDRIDAYRAALQQRGYSPAAAEQMTVDFHRIALMSAKETP